MIIHFLAFGQLNGLAGSLGPSHTKVLAGELIVLSIIFLASYSRPKLDWLPVENNGCGWTGTKVLEILDSKRLLDY